MDRRAPRPGARSSPPYRRDRADRHRRAQRRARTHRGRAVTTARTLSIALSGLDGAVVEVEADLSRQTPGFRVIGLPDKAIGEAVQRVTNACANRTVPIPRRRLTVNLSPSSLPKHGAGFHVALAVAALVPDPPIAIGREVCWGHGLLS